MTLSQLVSLSLSGWWFALRSIFKAIEQGLETTGFLHSFKSLDSLTVHNFTYVYPNLSTFHHRAWLFCNVLSSIYTKAYYHIALLTSIAGELKNIQLRTLLSWVPAILLFILIFFPLIFLHHCCFPEGIPILLILFCIEFPSWLLYLDCLACLTVNKKVGCLPFGRMLCVCACFYRFLSPALPPSSRHPLNGSKDQQQQHYHGGSLKIQIIKIQIIGSHPILTESKPPRLRLGKQMIILASKVNVHLLK